MFGYPEYHGYSACSSRILTESRQRITKHYNSNFRVKQNTHTHTLAHTTYTHSRTCSCTVKRAHAHTHTYTTAHTHTLQQHPWSWSWSKVNHATLKLTDFAFCYALGCSCQIPAVPHAGILQQSPSLTERDKDTLSFSSFVSEFSVRLLLEKLRMLCAVLLKSPFSLTFSFCFVFDIMAYATR